MPIVISSVRSSPVDMRYGHSSARIESRWHGLSYLTIHHVMPASSSTIVSVTRQAVGLVSLHL